MFKTAPSWVPWLGIFSLILFLGALVLLPVIVKRLPHNIFLPGQSRKIRHSPIHFLLQIIRNLMGLLLLLAGFVMLFIPGQGVLTMLAGLILITFPGKKKLVYIIISQKYIQNSLNHLRKKSGKTPFIFPASF